jgi:hypothetical protein
MNTHSTVCVVVLSLFCTLIQTTLDWFKLSYRLPSTYCTSKLSHRGICYINCPGVFFCADYDVLYIPYRLPTSIIDRLCTENFDGWFMVKLNPTMRSSTVISLIYAGNHESKPWNMFLCWGIGFGRSSILFDKNHGQFMEHDEQKRMDDRPNTKTLYSSITLITIDGCWMSHL